jgi:RalA-binding protein 1
MIRNHHALLIFLLLQEQYNKGQQPVYLLEHEPNIVASLLKQYLRDLPEPVLTSALMPKFEQASSE